MRRWSKRRARGPLETLAIGFVLFIMLCAVLLLVVPGPGAPGSGAAGDGPPAEVHQALGEIELAAQALDAANYGRARWHITQARQSLSGLLPASQ